MQVTIDTKIVMLLGTPLSQSFAARMQNCGYEAAGVNLLYLYTEVDQSHLGEVVNGLRFMNVAGFAVTKPNKVKVLEYLDELDPLCEKMGSCNTVVRREDGRLVGYNTDGSGFYTAITRKTGLDVRDRAFFCIGGGGAGRAICSALAYHGASKIYVMDQREASSRKLVRDINMRFASVAEFVPFEDFSRSGDCCMVINASGVGMGDSIGRSPMPEEAIEANQLYFDACYNPNLTRFLENAKKRGCPVMNGLDMSLYQGAAQFELWTGKKAPIKAMRQELERILAEKAGK